MKPRPAHRPTARAFTLLEVLIAVMVFAVVLAAINAVFYGALRLRNTTARKVEQALPLERTLSLMRRDLANLVTPGGTLFGPLQTTPTSGATTTNSASGSSPTASSLGSRALGTAANLDSPDFYTSTGAIDDTTPWAEVQRVSYHLVVSTNDAVGSDLVRVVARNLLPTLEDATVEQPLMGGIRAMTYLFHDGTQWKETWDSSTEETPLPRAIKVILERVAPDEESPIPPPVELVVPLAIAMTAPASSLASTNSP